MKAQATLVPLEEALRTVDQVLAGRELSRERVATRNGVGRVLAGDQCSLFDLPPFDKAAVDGYAIPDGDDAGVEYRLIESVAAGRMASRSLAGKTAARVMTGAPVPAGTGRVVMQEDVDVLADSIRIRRLGNRNLCHRGEDIRRGDTVLRAGTVLRPLDVANLIGCGLTEVEVFRRLSVSIISTGDEIADDPCRLGPAQIMNVNGPLLASLSASYGLDVRDQVSVPDVYGALCRAVGESLEKADMTILSGGVSVGDLDLVPAVLKEIGLCIHFGRIAVKPGKPTTFASGKGKVVFGLPGNPVSVFLMFHLFVLRAAARRTGVAQPIRTFLFHLERPFSRRRAERTEFVPARLTNRGAVDPVEYHGSAHLLGLSQADGFFVVPRGVTELPAGEEVEFISLASSSR